MRGDLRYPSLKWTPATRQVTESISVNLVPTEMPIDANHMSGPRRTQQRNHTVLPDKFTVRNYKQRMSFCLKLLSLDGLFCTVDSQWCVGDRWRSPSQVGAALLSSTFSTLVMLHCWHEIGHAVSIYIFTCGNQQINRSFFFFRERES